MAFFKKKLSLDEILKGIDNLSDEEKAELGVKMKDLYKAEDEREIDKIESEKADNPEIADEKEEEVKEESEEIGKDVDEVEGEVEKDETAEETPDGKEEVGEVDEDSTEDFSENESARDELANENRDQLIHALTDRVNELEKRLNEFSELYDLMQDFTKKQAESFGYKGNLLGAKKDIHEMSTGELKARQMKGI